MRKVLWSSRDNVISVIHSPEGEFDGKNTHYYHLYIDGNVNKSAEEIISLSSTHLDKLGRDYLDMAKKFLADAGIAYETVVVNENPELARQYGVRQAPTLLVLENGKEVRRVENPSNIRAFCESAR